MKLAPFDYSAPGTVEDTLRLLSDAGPDEPSALLAGGQSLLPRLLLTRLQVGRLIDINGLTGELGHLTCDGATVRLGALVRQRKAETDANVARYCPLLAEAVGLIGRPAVRTRGTIGGSLAQGDSAGEIPTVACALDAEIDVVGPGGERTIRASDFFVGPLRTALRPGEVLTELRLPVLPERSGCAFVEVSPRYGDRCIVGAASAVTLGDGAIAEARIALAGVGATPTRAARAESVLSGAEVSPDAVRAAAAIAAQDVDPQSDIHASAEYRRHVTGVLVGRAIMRAIDRARGGA